MSADYSYRVFKRFAELDHIKYNEYRFKKEDMYFCKIWKAHRWDFASICKKHKCEKVFIDLNDRCCQYEFKILEMKFRNGQINNIEYNEIQREIFKSYL